MFKLRFKFWLLQSIWISDHILMMQEKRWQIIENIYFSFSNHRFHGFSSILMALACMEINSLGCMWVTHDSGNRWKFVNFSFYSLGEVGGCLKPFARCLWQRSSLAVSSAGASVRRESYVPVLFSWQLITPLLLFSLFSILPLSEPSARRVQWLWHNSKRDATTVALLWVLWDKERLAFFFL